MNLTKNDSNMPGEHCPKIGADMSNLAPLKNLPFRDGRSHLSRLVPSRS